MTTINQEIETRTSKAITHDNLQQILQSKVAEVACEPEYSWGNDFKSFMTDSDGKPVVRVAITNCAPDMDIWEGLRSPASVGMYPLNLEDIWMHYAAANVKSTRFDGSPNPLAMPETYYEATNRIHRAVIVSAMLVINPQIYELYAEKVKRGDEDPFDYYGRAMNEAAAIIDKSVAKSGLSLMAPERAVVPMTNKNTDAIINRTRSDYTKGKYHGPCNNHWPQNSITVMTGLMSFGINRLPFRDEVGSDGKRQRLYGKYRSIVIFDEAEPVANGADGISLLDSEQLAWLRRVNDYTDVSSEVVAERYCTYNLTKPDGTSVCGKCIDMCPSNALLNSSPLPDGTYTERISNQKHRFWEGTVDFDYGNCCRERGQKALLMEEYVCARCETICAAYGIRKSASEIESINGSV